MNARFGNNGGAPGPPLADALLDWPMGFRLLVLTIAAATLCLVATMGGLLIRRRMQTEDLGRSSRIWFGVGEALLGSLMVGVLYILTAYAIDYIGYIGPLNAGWFVGVPLAVALIQQERLARAIFWTFPLLWGGWLCMGILSMTVGIPLD